VKRPVIAALRWLGGRSGVLGVMVAQALAWLTRPLGHGIDEDRLTAVFPELDQTASRGVRQRTWENFLKGEAVEAAVMRGRYPRLVRNAQLTALRPPLVLASFHVGPWPALAAALVELPGEVLALDRGQFGPLPHLTMLAGGEDTGARAAAFNRALGALRSGGFVFVTVDAFHQQEFDVASIEVPVLGRTLPLARGAFALARIARVPIVPIVARWRGTALEVELGPALRVGAGGERSLAEAAGSWIERYVRARPGEMSVFMLERLQPPVLSG
jgi:lauroyl/myristoyl acyltransferase